MAKKFDFEKLEPKGVLTWFKKICSIPHGSYNEAALAEMLKHALNKAGCYVKQYSSGAIYARKAATKGLEKKPLVLLQAHMDMVLAKEPRIKIDLTKEPIKPFYDTTDGYIKCDGTSLGADDGVGVAAIMELFTSSKYQHGPLEALLSVTEEADIQYCMSTLPKHLFKAKHLVNLDIDAPEKMYCSSNGADTITCERELHFEPIHKGTKTYIVELLNFDGGHSGLSAHNPLNSAVVSLCESLYSFTQKYSKISLISLDGGSAFNAIPQHAKMLIQMTPKDIAQLKRHLNHDLKTFKTFAQGLDLKAEAKVMLAKHQEKKACSYSETENVLLFYSYALSSIDRMDICMKHIFSSNNIGIVQTKDQTIYTKMLARCFFKDGMSRIFDKLRYMGLILGFKNFKQTTACAPWLTEHPDQVEIIQLWSKCYTKVTGEYTFPVKDPAGIEPSAIIENSPQLLNHAVGVGPKMFGCHSPSEKVEVKSILSWWKTLLLLLKEIK